MLAFLVRRLLQSIIVMLVVALVSFSLFNFVGDPINNMVGQETTLQQREELREQLGLNDPFVVQFARFVGNAVQGNFGISYRLARPVDVVIAERLPATLELAIVSALFALVVGVATGVYPALNRWGIISRVIMTLSLLGVSLPTFLIGSHLI